MRPEEELLNRLRREVPELDDTYREHLEDNDELLPYVLMDAISRVALAWFDGGGTDREPAQKLFDLLESAMAGGPPEVKTMIRTSFVESVEALTSEPAKFEALWAALGPSLRAASRWTPDDLRRGPGSRRRR